MLGKLLALIIPFFPTENGLRKDYLLVVFFSGLVTDLISGWTLGTAGLFLLGEYFVVLVYEQYLRLRIGIRLALSLAFVVLYSYVSGRVFF